MKIPRGSYFVGVVVAVALSYAFLPKEKSMHDIKFDLGTNIIETARKSGVNNYNARNVDGFVSYSVNDLAPDITARLGRHGYELSLAPLFAFTMYADRDNDNNLAVESVRLQFASTPFKSHDAAMKFVAEITEQMASKKWRRYIDELCPAVSGRSAYLTLDGKLEPIGGCPLDPAHRIARDDWIELMRSAQYYEWHGDGIIASLRAGYSEDNTGITYRFIMEFEDIAIRSRKSAQRLAQELAEGDAAGRKSSEEYKNEIKARKKVIEIAEAEAIKRGDTVVPR